MKQLVSLVPFLVFSFLSAYSQKNYQASIDLRKVANDRVTVEIKTPRISENETTFHVPRIVPGTYAVANYGSYITNFKALDKTGNVLVVEHPDANTWKIKDAQKLVKVSYEVNDSWDSPEIKEDIFEPAGTDIENDTLFVLNTFGFIGYIEGKENKEFQLTVYKPAGMYGSTSLVASKGSNSNADIFNTRDYHSLVDAPIMYSKPDTAWLKVGNTSVLISLSSPNGRVAARDLVKEIKPLLEGHKNYLGGELPVDKYAFIVYLSDRKDLTRFGALEHSQSCFSFLPENLPPQQLASSFRDVASHEFLHIVTPLNIHSEEIGNFDYINTKMSKHLWLYEGLTEYAAHHSQLRYNLIDLPAYLSRQVGKYRNATTYFNDSLAFTELSLQALDKQKSQYGNVYEKGALIGLCLDVKLLQLSNGKYGTRELMKDLAKTYGKKKSFKDEELFDKITALTYPEIRNFFRDYVEAGKPLPLKETFGALGLDFDPKFEKTVVQIRFGVAFAPNEKRELFIPRLDENITGLGKRLGFEVGDRLVSLNGEPISAENFQQRLGTYRATAKLGDNVTFEVKRTADNGEEKVVKLSADIKEEKETSVLLAPMKEPSEQQLKIRSSWLGR
ncbi:peptidase M61 [soil metagenome]